MNDGRMAAARPIVDSLPRRRLGPALCVAAIALMLYGAFWPIFGVPAGRAVQLMAVLAAAVLLIGGVLAPQGSQLAFTLLWASFGMTCAIGTIRHLLGRLCLPDRRRADPARHLRHAEQLAN